MRMGGRSEAGLAVYFAFEGCGAQIEGIARRKMDFDHAAVILEAVNSVGKKFAVEQNVALGRLRVHVVAAQAEKLKAAADRRNFQSSRATNALERTANGSHGEITGSVFQVNSSAHCFHIHIAKHVCDRNLARIVVNLELGILGDVDLIVGAKVV